MNAIRTFEVYLVEDTPYGYEIETPYPASLRGFDQSYDFPGKTAHIVIVSNDWGVGRSIALSFAKAIAFGTFKTIRIDLEELGYWRPKRSKK